LDLLELSQVLEPSRVVHLLYKGASFQEQTQRSYNWFDVLWPYKNKKELIEKLNDNLEKSQRNISHVLRENHELYQAYLEQKLKNKENSKTSILIPSLSSQELAASVASQLLPSSEVLIEENQTLCLKFSRLFEDFNRQGSVLLSSENNLRSDLEDCR
jgi:hypothetical protein